MRLVPFSTTIASGVFPLESLISTDAPLLKSSSTQCTWPELKNSQRIVGSALKHIAIADVTKLKIEMSEQENKLKSLFVPQSCN